MDKDKRKLEFFINNMFFDYEIEEYYTENDDEIKENIKAIKEKIETFEPRELLTTKERLLKHDYFLNIIAHVIPSKNIDDLDLELINRLIRYYNETNTFFNKEGDNAYKIIDLYGVIVNRDSDDEYYLNDTIVETLLKDNGYSVTDENKTKEIKNIINDTWENKTEIITTDKLDTYSEKRNGLNFKYFLFCEEYIKTGRITEVAKNLNIGRRTCYDYLGKKEVKEYLKERQNEIREENTELMKQRHNDCFDTLYNMSVIETHIDDNTKIKALDTFLKHYENIILKRNDTNDD